MRRLVPAASRPRPAAAAKPLPGIYPRGPAWILIVASGIALFLQCRPAGPTIRFASLVCHVVSWLVCLQIGLEHLSRLLERYPGVRTVARWAFIASTLMIYGTFAGRLPALLQSGMNLADVLWFLRGVPMLAVAGTLLGIAGCQSSVLSRTGALYLYSYVAVNLSEAVLAGRLGALTGEMRFGCALQLCCGVILLVLSSRYQDRHLQVPLGGSHERAPSLVGEYIGFLFHCASAPARPVGDAGRDP